MGQTKLSCTAWTGWERDMEGVQDEITIALYLNCRCRVTLHRRGVHLDVDIHLESEDLSDKFLSMPITCSSDRKGIRLFPQRNASLPCPNSSTTANLFLLCQLDTVELADAI